MLKYRKIDGKPRFIIGYSQTLVTLGVFILWYGWYGFNPGAAYGLSIGKTVLAGHVAMNSTLSASSSGITSIALLWLMHPNEPLPNIAHVMNGSLILYFVCFVCFLSELN